MGPVSYTHLTMWVTNDNVTIQQLPSAYCDIAVIEGNVLNVRFDFSYFDVNTAYLDLYPEEFRRKYTIYQNDRTGSRWQELDSPSSFAVKCNNDILNYSIPPFAGIFREIYDLEDYKNLKLTKTELENYAILVMTLGINADGEWEMDEKKARDFYSNLANVLPEEIGAVLSPMPVSYTHLDVYKRQPVHRVRLLWTGGSEEKQLATLLQALRGGTQSAKIEGEILGKVQNIAGIMTAICRQNWFRFHGTLIETPLVRSVDTGLPGMVSVFLL